MVILNEIIWYLEKSYQINPLWQLIWFVWFVLWVIAFLYKDDSKTKSIHWLSLFLWVIHYYLFWLYTWVASDLLWWFRNLLSIKYKKNKRVIIILFVLYWIAWYVTYDNIYSLFPIISWLIATLAFFYLEWIKMRLALLSTCIFWMIYNYFWHSIWWMITDIFFIWAHWITITRLLLKPKKIILNS